MRGANLSPLSYSTNSELEASRENEKRGLVNRVVNNLRIAYKFYFNTEIYYYLHREAKYR
jgi:hypothetical protein